MDSDNYSEIYPLLFCNREIQQNIFWIFTLLISSFAIWMSGLVFTLLWSLNHCFLFMKAKFYDWNRQNVFINIKKLTQNLDIFRKKRLQLGKNIHSWLVYYLRKLIRDHYIWFLFLNVEFGDTNTAEASPNANIFLKIF